MPTSQALQVFYGTLPLVGAILWAAFSQRLLLQDILKRLTALETRIKSVEDKLGKVVERLTVLETRAGIIYHE
jgi:chaperonin cofactor prefoldin